MLYPFSFEIAFNSFSKAGIDKPSASFVSKKSLSLLFPKYFSTNFSFMIYFLSSERPSMKGLIEANSNSAFLFIVSSFLCFEDSRAA